MSTKSTAQLHCSGLTVERGGSVVVRDVSLTISPGDRIGLVGPNGSGKSTLLAALAGDLAPRAGVVSTVPIDATVGRLAQEIEATEEETVADYVARLVGVGPRLRRPRSGHRSPGVRRPGGARGPPASARSMDAPRRGRPRRPHRLGGGRRRFPRISARGARRQAVGRRAGQGRSGRPCWSPDSTCSSSMSRPTISTGPDSTSSKPSSTGSTHRSSSSPTIDDFSSES